MSNRTPVLRRPLLRKLPLRKPLLKRLLLAKPRLTALLVAFAAAMGMMVSSVAPAYASGTNCGPDAAGDATICMHIDGASNVVNDAIGQLQVTSSKGVGEWTQPGPWVLYSGHIQVVNPNGTTLCNSVTKTLAAGVALSCESPNPGATYTGAYCTILWVWSGSEYNQYGQECLNVFK